DEGIVACLLLASYAPNALEALRQGLDFLRGEREDDVAIVNGRVAIAMPVPVSMVLTFREQLQRLGPLLRARGGHEGVPAKVVAPDEQHHEVEEDRRDRTDRDHLNAGREPDADREED